MTTHDSVFLDDAGAIQAVIADYFHGIFHGDIERLRRAFHPRAALFGDVNGQPYFRELDVYLETVRTRQSPAALGEPFRMKTLSIDILNSIASVRLHVPMLGFRYQDILALNKIDGQWRIVSKLFTNIEPT